MINENNPNLILCAGWSVKGFNNVEYIAKEIGKSNSNTYAVVETQYDHLPSDVSSDRYHVVYLINPKGSVSILGKQIFGQARNVRGKQGEACLAAFDATLDQRQGKVDNRNLISLCCGEINILHGRNQVHCVSEVAEDALSAADIIVNPTHDLMGNHGTLIAKRKWISKKIGNRNRIYISCSNWDNAGYAINNNNERRKRNKQTPRGKMIHTVFYNGIQQDMDVIHNGDGGFLYRQWDESSTQ